jgi:hypothetical protein
MSERTRELIDVRKRRATYRYPVILLQMDFVDTLYIDSNIQTVITDSFGCNQKW